VVTELPYSIGPEKVMARIKDLVQAKKLNGISDLKDLTDRHRGLHLVIEIRSGFNPEAVLAELYRLTPMEETFGINNVALVDGQPRVLGLRELLDIYVTHRLEVTSGGPSTGGASGPNACTWSTGCSSRCSTSTR